ncbi:hypothetical protein [Nodularia spumigena]|nr:hypothetical protein NSP_11180 [Nodularia spumigena CCY9414]
MKIFLIQQVFTKIGFILQNFSRNLTTKYKSSCDRSRRWFF